MLRLHHDGVSAREIGRTLGVARSTIQDNLERARKAGIGCRRRHIFRKVRVRTDVTAKVGMPTVAEP
jgi:IS30 family transposase